MEEKPQNQTVTEGEARLKRWVEIIQGRKDIPAFSCNIMRVMGMMGSDEASFQVLTNTILRDYSLTLAVLRLANSAYYSRSRKPIYSLTRAVTLMGIDSIKRLAGNILLLENYDKRPVGLKELLLLSLLTASHAYETARSLGIGDAEQIYMCGMFRNLGEVMMALYFTDAYEKILREMKDHNLSGSEACLKVTEITYENLGHAVAASWKLPGSIAPAHATCNPATFGKQDEDQKLETLVAFSHELTHCVYRRASEDRTEALSKLIEKYNSIPNLSQQKIQKVLDDSVTKTKDTFAAAGVPLNDLHLRHQYELVLAGTVRPQGSASATLTAVMDIGPPQAEADTEAPPAADEALLAQLLAEVQVAVDPGNEPKLHEVLMLALETCHRGAGFERVVFCLASRDRTEVRGRIGLGPNIDRVIELLHIPLFGQENLLTLPLLAKKDIFIDAEVDGRYRDSSLVARLGASCFGLYPVVVDDVVVGCLYVDKLTPGAVPPQKILDTLARLRDMLAGLIRRTRQQ